LLAIFNSVAKSASYHSGNQPHLHADIERLSLTAMEQDDAARSQQYHETHAHGCDEWRFCFVLNDLNSLRNREEWPGVARSETVIVDVRLRVVNGKRTSERRNGLSHQQPHGECDDVSERRSKSLGH
jgi:hypothetical protein